MRTALLPALGLGLLGVALAVGQTPTNDPIRRPPIREGAGKTPARPAPAARGHRLSELMGRAVTLRGGTSLGAVSDVVVDAGGRVDYLIVRSEGNLIAVPWGVLDHTGRGIAVTADVKRDRLRDVTFRAGSWPDFASERWLRGARSTWGDAAMPRDRDVPKARPDRPPPPPSGTSFPDKSGG